VAKSTQASATRVRRPRAFGLPISAWLVIGFALVIGAFASTSIVAVRGTRQATADLAAMQRQFEPLARSVRDLGDSMASFDRAVLAFLRADSDANRAATADAAARLSYAIQQASRVGGDTQTTTMRQLLQRVAARQVEGFRLLELQDERRRTVVELDEAYADLHRRALSGGGAGVRIGDNVLSKPSLTELTRAVEAARADASAAVALHTTAPASLTEGERTLRRTLDANRDEFVRTPGQVWFDLMDEDINRSVVLRRHAQQADADIETRRSAFVTSGDALAVEVRSDLETPAWRSFIAAATEARSAVETSARRIETATAKAILLALLALAIMAWAITWPVRRLTAGARRLAAGDLAARVPRGGASEVDELAIAFNHMASELDLAERAVRSYQAQLEQRVEERTLQLRHLAEHDPLTNLPNRRQLFQHLNELIDKTPPGTGGLAVMFLDLDNFKTVNDSLGHEFGDRVLTEIGERLREITGESSFIARLGGDEFTLVFSHTGDHAEVEQRASRIVDGFQRPLSIDRREVSVGVSCGVALFPEHGRDATALLRAADAALFRAKDLGRNRLCIHDPVMLVDASNRFRIEQALRKAIDGGDFVLHYQPQVSLGSRRTVCMEALLRWRTSDTHIVPAGEFIRVAEQSGLMLDLNDWVLETAANAVREWRNNGWPEARVAVNVSAQQFVAGDFLGAIERLLARCELPADALELELTENMLQTGAVTVDTLRSLARLGVATSLDDFGTGYSSLTSLEQLPLNCIKLDRSVITAVDHNPRAAAIAHSIITLCRSLGLVVTAEGVERHEHLDFLAGCGDVLVQGYLIGRPMEASGVMDFVKDTEIRIATLLQVAALHRPPEQTDSTGTVRLLRRWRRQT
jgi:diguanylate cyclase (GGDEF)-like protein